MTTAAARKTSLENKHLHRCDYFLIIRHCLQSMLEKYSKTRLGCRPLNFENLPLFAQVVIITAMVEISRCCVAEDSTELV